MFAELVCSLTALFAEEFCFPISELLMVIMMKQRLAKVGICPVISGPVIYFFVAISPSLLNHIVHFLGVVEYL